MRSRRPGRKEGVAGAKVGPLRLPLPVNPLVYIFLHFAQHGRSVSSTKSNLYKDNDQNGLTLQRALASIYFEFQRKKFLEGAMKRSDVGRSWGAPYFGHSEKI